MYRVLLTPLQSKEQQVWCLAGQPGEGRSAREQTVFKMGITRSLLCCQGPPTPLSAERRKEKPYRHESDVKNAAR